MANKNMISYVKRYCEPIEQRELGEVDSLILSWLAYLNIPKELKGAYTTQGISIMDLYNIAYRKEILKDVKSAGLTWKLLANVCCNPRFRTMRMYAHCENLDIELDKQFAAITFEIAPNTYYVAYRGTDCSYAGWKEDLNLAFTRPIPSQQDAVEYVERIAKLFEGTLYLGGHSKGGNLAVYAAAKCSGEVYERIKAVYSHDGPGFLKETLQSADFCKLKNILHKTVPQSSIIGMLLEHHEDYKIIKSSKMNGFTQHYPFTWLVDKTEFIAVDQLTVDAKLVDRSFSEWLEQLEEGERRLFIDSLFDILYSTNTETFTELGANLTTAIPIITKEAAQLQPETRRFLMKTIMSLAGNIVKNVPDTVKNTLTSEG